MGGRNGTDPRGALPDLPNEAPPQHSGPVAVLERVAGAGIALKVVFGVVVLIVTAAGGMMVGVRGAATGREVDQAELRAEKYADHLVENHGTRAGAVDVDHEKRLQALERDQDWQGMALAAIADKLKVTLPPRPRRSSP